MISLTKLPEPAVLSAKKANWTAALLAKYAAGQKPTYTESSRYRHVDIKDVLVQETCGKCAYCESKLQHIHHGDVEHIYPKSLDRTKTFEWDNLTLACEVCNQNKSNRDPNMDHIIDPYKVDPEQHLIFVGPLIFSRGTASGTATRAVLELHRAELVEMREAQLEKVMGVFTQVLDKTLPLIVRKALLDDLRKREASPTAAYSAMTKGVFEIMEAILEPELFN